MHLRRRVRHLALGAAFAFAVVAGSVGIAAAASPVVRLSIVHTVHGCHVWVSTKVLGPSATITVSPGTRLVIKPACPMDFDFVQIRGPAARARQPADRPRKHPRSFSEKPGVYRLTVKNVQAPADVGLQTLGPDNVLVLTVVVR